jgi:hypothetical protein
MGAFGDGGGFAPRAAGGDGGGGGGGGAMNVTMTSGGSGIASVARSGITIMSAIAPV